MHIERIPGFAICAECGARNRLGPCAACGMLTCADCRGQDDCVVCFRERVERVRRAVRRAAVRQSFRRAGVVMAVSFCGLAALGASFLPEPRPVAYHDPHLVLVARAGVRFVADAVLRWSDANGARCPDGLGALRRGGYLLAPPIDPWGETLLFGCAEAPRSFVVVSKGPDRELGSDDDVLLAFP